ncbi:MAG: DUF167 family protein [bacterium]
MYIHVKVTAGAKEEMVEQKSETRFVVKIKEKAERNMANERVVQIFKVWYGTGKVRIINGHHSPSKLLSIDIDEE